jgi:uncharacterized repeat protein (TIGR01451 family)
MLLGMLECLVIAGLVDREKVWASGHPVLPVLPGCRQALEPPLEHGVMPYADAGGIFAPKDPPVPVVAVRVRVPATGGVDQELAYRICIENRSPAAAHHVIVRNPIPPHARYVRATPEPSAREPELTWQLGTLPAGSFREIILVLAPTGQGDVTSCARVQFEHGECVTTTIPRPGVKLRKDGPTQAVLNDTLTFLLTVTNTGQTELTDVMLKDSLPAGLEHASGNNALTWTVGKLVPGQSSQVEYQAVAKKTGQLCNKATASAAGGLRHDAEHCVTVAEAKLDVRVTGPERRYVNTGAAFQISVTNAGTVPLTEVAIRNPLPQQTTFASASGQGQLMANEVQWVLGTLAPGENRTVDVVLKALAEGQIINRAIVTAKQGITAEAEARTTFVGVSALLLELIEAADPVAVGAETSYAIVVKNPGSTQVTDVRIVAHVPRQMEVLRVTGPAQYKTEGQRITFQPIALKALTETRFVIYVKAKEAGDVRFKVDLQAAELTSGPIHEEESTTIYSDLSSALRRLRDLIYPSRLRKK